MGVRGERHALIHRPTLAGSVWVALFVGTVLSAIDQLDVVAGGHVGPMVIARVLLADLVPFPAATYSALASGRKPYGGRRYFGSTTTPWLWDHVGGPAEVAPASLPAPPAGGRARSRQR
jgi:hypothetical protein